MIAIVTWVHLEAPPAAGASFIEPDLSSTISRSAGTPRNPKNAGAPMGPSRVGWVPPPPPPPPPSPPWPPPFPGAPGVSGTGLPLSPRPPARPRGPRRRNRVRHFLLQKVAGFGARDLCLRQQALEMRAHAAQHRVAIAPHHGNRATETF